MTGDDPRPETGDDAVSYLCPYCDAAAYPTERLVRVHISYAEDADHEGRDGMTPEVEPIELDASGERVGRAFTLAGQLNLHGLELEDMPTTHDGRTLAERERRALLIAAFNANRAVPLPELQDRVTAHLDQRDLDPLSVDELRRLCRSVFCPHLDEEDDTDGTATDRDEVPTEITTAETTLRDLTPLQQAIILTRVAQPDIDPDDIATRVGTARSYPQQVVDARSDLVERLRARREHHGGLEPLVAARVPDADIEVIRAEGYLDGLGIDLDAALDDPDAHDVEPTPTGDASPAGHPERSDRAGPNPAGRADSTGHRPDAAEAGGETHDPGGDRSPTDAADGHRQEVDSDQDGDIPREAVEQVRDQIRFDLAVIEQEMDLVDPTPQQVRTKAYLEQILDRLDDILS